MRFKNNKNIFTLYQDKELLVIGTGTYKITKVNKKFMRIRVKEPNPKLWHSIKKIKRKYYICSDIEKGATRFITLDIGDLDKPKVQGIAFIRGFPKDIKPSSLNKVNYEIGDLVDWKDARTQAIIIEYKALNISNESTSKEKINSAYIKYEKDIKSFLSRELNKNIKNIKITPKEDDFSLSMNLIPLMIRKDKKNNKIELIDELIKDNIILRDDDESYIFIIGDKHLTKEELIKELDSMEKIVNYLKGAMDGAEEEAYKGLKTYAYRPEIRKYFTNEEIIEYGEFASEYYDEKDIKKLLKEKYNISNELNIDEKEAKTQVNSLISTYSISEEKILLAIRRLNFIRISSINKGINEEKATENLKESLLSLLNDNISINGTTPSYYANKIIPVLIDLDNKIIDILKKEGISNTLVVLEAIKEDIQIETISDLPLYFAIDRTIEETAQPIVKIELGKKIESIFDISEKQIIEILRLF